MASDRVTIIILTYKSKHIIDECLSEIKGYENIIIVDNVSGDGIGEHIKNNYPHIKFIGLEENVGFGRANNIALKQVETEYALVLNPDAKITPESIDKVIEVMDSLPSAALGSPVIFNDKVQKLRYKILKKLIPSHNFESMEDKKLKKLKSIKRRSKRLKINEAANENVVNTNFIWGCGMFFKMSLMREVGFFDENIFMYYEDNIISENVIKSGYDNVIVKDASLRHIGNGSSNAEDKSFNEKLEYFKNWHTGWSHSYFLSKSGKGRIKKKKLMQLKYKLLSLKLRRKNTVALRARIDGFVAQNNGADPFKKSI